ncbi:hypothetical protein VTO42DRAFT_1399 [Malbranchea cinnamomea]
MTDAPPRSEPRRSRTKKACLTCQRKKLKCNGLQPCSTCSSRGIRCTYSNLSSSLKRRQEEEEQRRRNLPLTPQRLLPNESRVGPSHGELGENQTVPIPRLAPRPQSFSAAATVPLAPQASTSEPQVMHQSQRGGGPSHPAAAPSRDPSASASEANEGENLKESSRLLQDGHGRLLYLGDSASLSYLDTIRRVVESTMGPSNFTTDPHKIRLFEGSISTARRPTHVLPDREAAEFLVDSYFSNTVGIVHILDRETFTQEVATIYGNPLQVEQSRLCILNLVFAVGLQLTRGSVVQGYRESQILKRLDGGSVNRAEMFYLNATHLSDPVSGFEDGDITSIQALLLLTLFMLTVSKRNAAWAYLGMAVRSAYALGLHRKKIAFAFTPAEQRLRRNIWRSMYILDCFLSASLGRPTGIHNRDAADSFDGDREDTPLTEEDIELSSLLAAVRAARLTGDILSSVYTDRKISIKLAQRLSSQFQVWNNSLPSILHWQNISLPNEDPRITLAQLHVNLSYFHGIILLTRPFLLQKIVNQIRPPRPSGDEMLKPPQATNKLESVVPNEDSFPAACVRAALYSIEAIQSALLKRAFPRRDPFVIYWLFTASLIVFSNGFCKVYGDIDNNHAMQTAINLHRYLGEADPLPRRYLQILTAFNEAIMEGSTDRVAPSSSKTAHKTLDLFAKFFGGETARNTTSGLDVGVEPETASAAAGPADFTNSQNAQPFPTASSGQQPATGASYPHSSGFSATTPSSVNAPEGVMLPPQQDACAIDRISPPDYSLDFDAFFAAVGGTADQGDAAFQQDLYMPLYSTADFATGNIGYKE